MITSEVKDILKVYVPRVYPLVYPAQVEVPFATYQIITALNMLHNQASVAVKALFLDIKIYTATFKELEDLSSSFLEHCNIYKSDAIDAIILRSYQDTIDTDIRILVRLLQLEIRI